MLEHIVDSTQAMVLTHLSLCVAHPTAWLRLLCCVIGARNEPIGMHVCLSTHYQGRDRTPLSMLPPPPPPPAPSIVKYRQHSRT